jgi:hypothetical protein
MFLAESRLGFPIGKDGLVPPQNFLYGKAIQENYDDPVGP